MPEQAQIDITIRLLMDRAKRDARQVQSFLAKIEKQATQTGKRGASGVDRLERAIQDLHYSTVAGFDAMSGAVQGFDDGLKKTKDDTEKLLQSYVDYSALAQDLAQSAGQIGMMGQEAAQRRDLAESFDLLAERAGLSGDEIVKAMQKASKGTVDANTIMATSNMVLGSRFKTSSEDMAKMMEFARLKSKQFGMSVTAAFQRMTYGAVKSEVEFLDELGIMIKLNDAVKMYADSLGISANALTANQRSQAIWNALLLQADEQLKEFPDGVDKATDVYERYRIKWLEITQAMEDFIDKSNIGPVMSIAAQAVQGVAAVMTPLILAKQMATQASIAHTAALTKETVAMTAQQRVATGLAGLGQVAAAKQAGARGGLLGRIAGKVSIRGPAFAKAGVLGKAGLGVTGTGAAVAGAVGLGVGAGSLIAVLKTRNKVLENTAKQTEMASEAQDEFIEKLRKQAKEEGDAVAVAQRYAEARRGVSAAIYKDGNALQDFMMAAARNQFNTEEQINLQKEATEQILLLASEAYPEYVAAIAAANAELPKGAVALEMMSKVRFDMRKYTSDATDALLLQKDAVAALAKEIGGPAFRQQVKAAEDAATAEERKANVLEDAQGIALAVLQRAGLATDDLAAKQQALALAMGDVTKENIAATGALETLTEGYALGVVSEERWLMGIRAAKTGLIELTAAEQSAIDTERERRAELDMAAIGQQEASRIASDAIKNYAMDADVARRTQEALSVAMKETSFAQIENRKELQLLAQGLAMGTVSQERYMRAVLQAKDGTVDMTAAEREAITVANQRAQAVAQEADHLVELAQIMANYQSQATQATEQYEASQEQAAIAHAQRKEDIERQHQARIADIERQFGKSKAAAAIARSGIAMLEAEELRDEQLADAERARFEGQAGEDRSFAETNAAAVESYDARLKEIDRARREELARVREMQRQETEALRQQQADMAAQIAEAQMLQTQLVIDEKRKQTDSARDAANVQRQLEFAAMQERMQSESSVTQNVIDNNAVRITSAQHAAAATVSAWRVAYQEIAAMSGGGRPARRPPRPRGGPRGGPRGRNVAGGGEGMVTGPATFSVGRGEREFVHFGGDQRQMAPASQMNVGGQVDLNVSSRLGEQAGPLANKIAEILIPQIDDFLADSVRDALA